MCRIPLVSCKVLNETWSYIDIISGLILFSLLCWRFSKANLSSRRFDPPIFLWNRVQYMMFKVLCVHSCIIWGSKCQKPKPFFRITKVFKKLSTFFWHWGWRNYVISVLVSPWSCLYLGTSVHKQLYIFPEHMIITITELLLSQICNAVAVAGLLGATLIIPRFVFHNVWKDPRQVI